MNSSRLIRVSVPLPVKDEFKARVLAAGEGITKSELIRRAVGEYLAKASLPQNVADLLKSQERGVLK